MEANLKVRVRYFAVLRDRAGVGEEVYETGCTTVGALVSELIFSRNLALPQTLVRPAVNGHFVDDDASLRDGDVVVLMPPVAGG